MENYTVEHQKELESIIGNSKAEMTDIVQNNMESLTNYCRFITKSPKQKRRLTFNDNYKKALGLNESSGDMFSHYNTRMSGPRITLDYLLTHPELPQHSLSNVSHFMGYESNHKNVKYFFDGTCYAGEWNPLGFAGKGIYKYPHGVIYDGEFNQNGEFHGTGTLIYPNGQKINGTWDKGKLTFTGDYQPPDSKKKKNHLSDRRYPIEALTQLGPPGQEHITSEHPSKPLPKGCFDVVDGIYIANRNYTMNHQTTGATTRKSFQMYEDRKLAEYYSPLHEAEMDSETIELLDTLHCKPEHCFFLTTQVSKKSDGKSEGEPELMNADVKDIPGSKKEQWIKKYCRTGTENPVGYAPELYEVFTGGAKEELEKLQKRSIKSLYYDDEFDEKYDELENDDSVPMMFAIKYYTKPKVIQRQAFDVKEPKRTLIPF